MALVQYTPEEKASLVAEFNNLTSIEEKFRFFNKKFKQFYSDAGSKFPLNDVKDFIIKPTTKEELEELNHLQLEEVKFTRQLFSNKKDRKDVFDFEKEKQILKEKLREVTNPLPILKKELEWIEEEVNRNETKVNLILESSIQGYKEKELRSFWLLGYNEFYLKGKEPDFREINCGPYSLLSLNNGFEVAQYKIFIDRKIEEVSNKQTPISQEETSLKRQLLILLYSGMLEKLNEIQNKDRNKLLSILLNRSEQSIKQDLTNIHKRSRTYKIRTEENYSFLFDLFNDVGLNESAEEVKRELDKLKEEKM